MGSFSAGVFESVFGLAMSGVVCSAAVFVSDVSVLDSVLFSGTEFALFALGDVFAGGSVLAPLSVVKSKLAMTVNPLAILAPFLSAMLNMVVSTK